MRVDCLKAMRLKRTGCVRCNLVQLFFFCGSSCFFFKRAIYNKAKGRAGGEKTDLYNEWQLLTYATAFVFPDFPACCSHPKLFPSFRNNQSRNSWEKILSLQNVELYQNELPLAVFVTEIDMVAWLLN